MKVLVLGKATERSESGEFASPEEFAAMDRYFQRHVPPAAERAGRPAGQARPLRGGTS